MGVGDLIKVEKVDCLVALSNRGNECEALVLQRCVVMIFSVLILV